MKKQKIIKIAGILLVILSFGFFAIASSSSSSSKSDKESEETSATKTGFGQTITFEGLELTFGDSIKWTKVDNEFSEHNKKDVIQIPVHVKNVSEDNNSLNMFYVKFFGSKGTETDEVGGYFDDTGILNSGELRPNAETDLNFYLIYDGDGTYFISFESWTEKTELGFEVSK